MGRWRVVGVLAVVFQRLVVALLRHDVGVLLAFELGLLLTTFNYF